MQWALGAEGAVDAVLRTGAKGRQAPGWDGLRAPTSRRAANREVGETGTDRTVDRGSICLASGCVPRAAYVGK